MTGPGAGADLGPDSLTWRWFADRRLALLGVRAGVLQNMLPALGQGVEEHSVWFADMSGRLQRSIPPIFETVYGADAVATGHMVRDFHTPIHGRMPDGSPYSALNPDTFYWAHATFVEHLVVAVDTFVKRLSEAEKDQLIAESVTWFARYGVSARQVPRTWAEFDDYWQRMLETELVRHRTAAYGMGWATKGWPRPSAVPSPVWAVIRRPLNMLTAFVGIGGLPLRARELLGLPWTPAQEIRYQRFAALSRRTAPLVNRLPRRLLMDPIAVRAYARGPLSTPAGAEHVTGP